MPKVSVIIPVYNVEKFIERCARSLFEQTLDDIEYIFVDDCTPDNSIEIIRTILQEYPEREAQVTFVKHETNQGLPSARNSGLEVATGDYIAHCDSDDWVETNMYEELYLEAIAKNADIAICDIRMVFQNHSHVFKSIKYNPDKKQMLNEYLTLEWNCTVNMIVNRNIYTTYNIRSPKHICFCEDFHLTVRLLYYANKIVKINQPFYNYNRQNNSSITHGKIKSHLHDRCRCDMEIIQFFIEHNVQSQYIKSFSHRVLKYKQEWVLDKKLWPLILNFYPDANSHLWSCPRIKFWRKIALWCVIKKIHIIPKTILLLRNSKHYILNQ